MKVRNIFFQPKSQVFRCLLVHRSLHRLFHCTSINMNSETNVLMPPSCVYGMKRLNRDAFIKEIEVPTVDIPAEELKTTLKELKPYLLKIIKLPPVQGDGKIKKILLNPTLYDEMNKKLDLKDVYWTKVILSYENFNHENIFKAILPPDTGGNVSGFSIIGHIIHLNLKPELFDYKLLIGEVLLDKNPIIKTVVNKAQTIDSEYRNFQIELLAGEPNYEVTVKENGFKYTFDFSKVFWNPRLVHEHAEIVKNVKAGDLVFDVFAGVGPFAIPLAKKKCVVHANDLNPHSYHWLCHNSKLNKVSNYVTAYNLDGREFIQTVVKENVLKNWNGGFKNSIHILMNLPACALEFLDAFHGLLKNNQMQHVNMPVVYCYFFLKKDENVEDVITRHFDSDFAKNIEVKCVRNVAPNKRMMRLNFQIPESVLFDSKESLSEPLPKKIKLSF